MTRARTIGLLLAGALFGVVIAIALSFPHAVPQNFNRALANVLVYEGGNDDDPRDPGGRTSRGIIQSEYNRYRDEKMVPRRDVWTADQAEIVDIYRAKYWQSAGVRGDDLPIGFDHVVFSGGVNSGVGWSGKTVRRMLNEPRDEWRITDQFVQRLRAMNVHTIIDMFVDIREAFLQSLRTCPYFCKGWLRRTASERAIAHLMAGAPASAFPMEELVPFSPSQDEPTGKAIISLEEFMEAK